MRMSITKWVSDTCNCEIQYQFDADLPQEARTHEAIDSVPCEHHKSSSHKEVHFSAWRDNAYRQACREQVAKDHGLKSHEEVEGNFDENRNLILFHPDVHADKIDQSISKVKKPTEGLK